MLTTFLKNCYENVWTFLKCGFVQYVLYNHVGNTETLH